MTTHTDLIARLRRGWTTDCLLAADALEALEQQVAALTDELNNIKKEAEMNQKWAFLEWRQRAEDAERQVAALTKEKNDWYRLHDHVTDELVSSQAREAKLRDAAKAVLEVGMGSDFEALNAALAFPSDDSALMERLKEEREQLIDDWTTTIATCYKSDDLLTAEQVVDLLCPSDKKADAIRVLA